MIKQLRLAEILRVFRFKFTLSCQQSDIVPIVCYRYQRHQGNWWQNFAAEFVDTIGNFAASVVDTGGKFATGVVDPVVHLDLQISPRIFEKI